MTYEQHSHYRGSNPSLENRLTRHVSKLETQATRNAATVVIRLPQPHTKLSGIVKQPAVYILRVVAPFPRPPYPGDAAHFTVGATLVQRQNIKAAYDANIKNFLTCTLECN